MGVRPGSEDSWRRRRYHVAGGEGVAFGGDALGGCVCIGGGARVAASNVHKYRVDETSINSGWLSRVSHELVLHLVDLPKYREPRMGSAGNFWCDALALTAGFPRGNRLVLAAAVHDWISKPMTVRQVRLCILCVSLIVQAAVLHCVWSLTRNEDCTYRDVDCNRALGDENVCCTSGVAPLQPLP